MELDNTFYAFVALVLFFGIVLYSGAHKKAGAALDDRAKLIEKELTDARQLRLDAEQLLRDYKQKKLDAQTEAADIIAAAKSQAKDYAATSATKLAETITRRTKQAETKIAQAEAAAVQQVRARAADLAINAATNIIVANKDNANLIADSIKAVSVSARSD